MPGACAHPSRAFCRCTIHQPSRQRDCTVQTAVKRAGCPALSSRHTMPASNDREFVMDHNVVIITSIATVAIATDNISNCNRQHVKMTTNIIATLKMTKCVITTWSIATVQLQHSQLQPLELQPIYELQPQI